jgi:hypothetical protein
MRMNIEILNRWAAWWVEKYQGRDSALRAFEIVIYVWLIIHALKIWSFNEILADSNSFCFDWYPARSEVWLVNLLKPTFFLPALVSQISLSAWMALRGSHYIGRAMLWLISVNIFFICPSMHDGGTRLLDIILFYLIFIEIKPLVNHDKHPIKALLTSFAVFSVQFQIALVYYENAFGKMASTHWKNGTVFSYIANIPEYSTPLMKQFLIKYSLLASAGAYGVIAFQFLFCFMMFTRMKNLWLLFGVIFHLSILVFIGLFTFSLMMICCYLVYLNNQDLENVKNFFMVKTMKLFKRLNPDFIGIYFRRLKTRN